MLTTGLVATTTLLANVLPPDPDTVTFGAMYATNDEAVAVAISTHVLVLAWRGCCDPLAMRTPMGFPDTMGYLVE